MQMDRHEFYEELKLRKAIREGISKILAEDRQVKLNALREEKQLRALIQKLISETTIPSNDPAPARTTGINVLSDLLKKIIPVLEDDYKKLTTNREQRDSFRAHILKAIEDTLKPIQVTDAADEEADLNENEYIDEAELTVGEEEVDPAFIDIDADGEKEPEPEPEPPDEKEVFGIEGKNVTGRNVAFESFKKVSSAIVDSYDVLSDPEDQDLFYDYLLKNIDLYMNKFESDMDPTPEKPEVIPDEEVEMTGSEGIPSNEDEPEEEIDLGL